MTTPAPTGVDHADDWHGGDKRVIFGPTESVGIRGGGVHVHASAVQHSDGRIDTEIHRPQVTFSMRGMPSMDVATARRLAAAIIEAADLCDRWMTDSL
jgi:hypothetical protein